MSGGAGQWKSAEQISGAVFVRHRLRVVAATRQDGAPVAVLVDDSTKRVLHLRVRCAGRPLGKAWLLGVLTQLDAGELPEQTPASRHAPADAYRLYAR